MKFKVVENYILWNIETTKKDGVLYTFLTNNAKGKPESFIVYGKKVDGLKEKEIVEVTLSITTNSERFMIQGQEKAQFIETVRIYVEDVKKVGGANA